MTPVKFEHLGYSVDYSVDGKYVGSKRIEEKDRELIGYDGRKTEISSDVILLDNKKKIKKGVKYTTILFPLNGKRIS